MSKTSRRRRLIVLIAVTVGLWVTRDQAQTGRTPLASGVFVLDETVSSLTASGTVGGTPVDPQGSGSLITSYSGTIAADFDLDAGTVQFLPGAAAAANSGNWQPRRGGGLGSEPANYGGQVPGLGVLAVRDLVFSVLTDQPIPLTPAGEGGYTFESTQTLAINAGRADYNFFGVFLGFIDLTGRTAPNSAAPGTLQDFGDGTFGLTVPVEFTFTDSVDGIQAALHMSGSIAGIAMP
jgi:hypothetical protein